MTPRIPRTQFFKCNFAKFVCPAPHYSLFIPSQLSAALFNLHFDLLRFCHLALGYMDLQQPIFELGPNLGRIGAFRQTEAAREASKRALRAMISLFLVFSLELSLAMNDEHPVFDIDLEIF